jgi:uncharacterized membrane protein YuzA (DUF378 family)
MGVAVNFQGVLVGAISFLVIGIFHPIVIKAEYHFGTKVWPVFLVVGLAALALSLFFKSTLESAILGVFGFSSLWGIREVFEQAKRVERGWFPRNPKRKY